MIEQVSTAVLIGLVVEMRVAVSALRREFDSHLDKPPHKKKPSMRGVGLLVGLTVSACYYTFLSGV